MEVGEASGVGSVVRSETENDRMRRGGGSAALDSSSSRGNNALVVEEDLASLLEVEHFLVFWEGVHVRWRKEGDGTSMNERHGCEGVYQISKLTRPVLQLRPTHLQLD